MTKWCPLHQHSSNGSLLDGLSKPNDIAKRCEELGYTSAALTDHGSLAGTVSFMKALNKKSIKPILGNELYLCSQDPTIRGAENRSLSHLVVLSKNLTGWKTLVKITSESNKKDYFYYKPRLNLDKLGELVDGNLISFSGHMGSDLANIIFAEPKLAYRAKSFEDAKKLINPNWLKEGIALAKKYQEIFGKDNFYIEIQTIDQANLPASEVVAKALRYISKKTGIPCVATADSHYVYKHDAADQRVLLCTAFNTTLNQVRMKLDEGEDVGLAAFFQSNNYHIPSYEEMVGAGHSEEELRNAVEIAEKCEEYSILSPPRLPKFDCPNGMLPNDYLKLLCRDGWKEKLSWLENGKKQVYVDRIKKELSVVEEANLASYFLMVQDYVNWYRRNGNLPGPGRGSAGGSLIAYLTGITSIDPVKYDLLFERFYNAGRNSPGRVSLPDIDCDFAIEKRQDVINYIRNKYGHDRVGQMATFARMQGRGAIKDVLRCHEACSFEEMNRITEYIPDEAEISDQLQAMREENDGEASIIMWALEHNAKELKEWAYIDDDGNIQGEYAVYFKQAIRLEGTRRSQGKHAAGIIISTEPLADICPMIYDKHGDEPICGWDMSDLEAVGLVKADILGVAALDKIEGFGKLLETGSL